MKNSKFIKIISKLTLIFMLNNLFSCAIKDPEYYSQKSPQLDIREYFNGNIEAYGVLKDWKGEVKRKFTVTMQSSWNENVGTLKEHFIFDDGKEEDRIWTLELSDKHHFTGTAHDVVKTAKGRQFGNAMRMDYTLRVDIDNKKVDLKVEDWMYLISDKNLINESKLKKFGITVAKLTIGFNKL